MNAKRGEGFQISLNAGAAAANGGAEVTNVACGAVGSCEAIGSFLDGTATFSSRSDDSTYLGYSDLNQGNSLLLPNRNLDFGFTRIDLGGSWEWHAHMAFYVQLQNLLSDQHIAPIGYPSLPMTLRAGVRYQLGGSPQ